MEFLWSVVFLLLPLPLVFRWLLKPDLSAQQARIQALRVPFFQQIRSFALTGETAHRASAKWPLILFWICCVVSAARPVWHGQAQTITQNVRNIVLALDASGSMQEQDFDINNNPVSRLNLVKLLVDDFLQKRQGDEISLVIFGSEAYTYTPLTYDMKTLRQLLSEIDVGIAGEMTAIGDALALSVANAGKVPAESRIVILLSDGTANAGVVNVQEAVKMAKKAGVKVYTIGVGSSPVMMRSFMGFRQLVNPAADLDEQTLTEIAEQTGGKYFRAKTSQDLKEIYETINALEPVQNDGVLFRPRTELFYVPLLLAFLFLTLAVIQRRGV